MSWRRLFPIIFLFSCVDGFISNWLYPAKLPFVLKDILILIVYLLFFITRDPRSGWLAEFKRNIGYGTWYIVILLIIWGGIQVFNPGVPRFDVGIFGFKTMFFYWPMAILAYVYIDSLDSLRSLLKKIVYFSIPICLFGIYQFWQGPNFLVSTFGQGFKRAIVMAGGYQRAFLRVLGTFASSGQFSQFLVINYMFIFSLLFTAEGKLKKSIMIGCLVLTYVAMLCTGTRSGLILLFLTTLLFVILCRWLWRTFFIILLVSVSLGFGFNYLGKTVLGRFETLKDVEMIRERTFGATHISFKTFLEEHPFGEGLGTATVATRYLYTEQPSDIEFIENYPAKLQYETGIIGVIIFYLFLIKLSIHWVKYWLKFTNRSAYIFIAALSSHCLVTFFITSLFGMFDSAPQAIFLWAEIGIVAKLSTFRPSDDKYPLST